MWLADNYSSFTQTKYQTTKRLHVDSGGTTVVQANKTSNYQAVCPFMWIAGNYQQFHANKTLK